MLCPLRWACLRSCLPPCLPSGLGCCVRLAGLVFLLSPVLSAILAGMLCRPRWAVSGLVSQLVSHLVACLSSGMLCLPPLGLSFSCLWSCLRACLPSGLGCCVRLLGPQSYSLLLVATALSLSSRLDPTFTGVCLIEFSTPPLLPPRPDFYRATITSPD